MHLRKDRDAQGHFYRQHQLPPDPEISQERIVDITHLSDLVDYLIKLMGVDHVGMGGDVNGIDDHQWPSGMDHIGELPNLTAELLRRGFGEDELEKLLASNWRRVYSGGKG